MGRTVQRISIVRPNRRVPNVHGTMLFHGGSQTIGLDPILLELKRKFYAPRHTSPFMSAYAQDFVERLAEEWSHEAAALPTLIDRACYADDTGYLCPLHVDVVVEQIF